LGVGRTRQSAGERAGDQNARSRASRDERHRFSPGHQGRKGRFPRAR
jgi:hypothetical protein